MDQLKDERDAGLSEAEVPFSEMPSYHELMARKSSLEQDKREIEQKLLKLDIEIENFRLNNHWVSKSDFVSVAEDEKHGWALFTNKEFDGYIPDSFCPFNYSSESQWAIAYYGVDEGQYAAW
ncbi:MAG: hypothetical protein F6K65_31740, partial [Moorea sp. SIO3C2]|nr:hypothetical protein [Moorena sp. SIO3C2]